MAAASASGISGMVSREEMLGLRERMLEGVDGIDEPDENEYPGYGSLYFVENIVDGWTEVGLPVGWVVTVPLGLG